MRSGLAVGFPGPVALTGKIAAQHRADLGIIVNDQNCPRVHGPNPSMVETDEGTYLYELVIKRHTKPRNVNKDWLFRHRRVAVSV
jgi:hypothetical protein